MHDDIRTGRTMEIHELMGTDLPATACFAPVVARWDTLAAGSGAVPPDDAFRAETLPDFAGRLSVLRPVDDGADFLYLIYAGAIINAGGVDMTGYRVSDFPFPDFRDCVLATMRRVHREERPAVWRFRHRWRGRVSDYCSLYLPLRHAATGEARLHSVIVNTDPARRTLYKAVFPTGRDILRPDQIGPERSA